MISRLLTRTLGTMAVLVAGVVFGVVVVRVAVDALRSEPPVVETIELTPAPTSVPVESAPSRPSVDDVSSEPPPAPPPPPSSPTPEPLPQQPALAPLTATPSKPVPASAPPPAPIGYDDDVYDVYEVNDIDDVDGGTHDSPDDD